mgnify:CR=1 FL=1
MPPALTIKKEMALGYHGHIIPIQEIPIYKNSFCLYWKYLAMIFKPIIANVVTAKMLKIPLSESIKLISMKPPVVKTNFL